MTKGGWSEVRLRDIVEVGPPPPEREDAQMVTFVPMAAVDDVCGVIGDPQIRPYFEVKKGYSRFRNGDILFAKITPCMENGKIAVAERLENGIGCGSTEFIVLRPAPGVLPRFIWYFTRQLSFRKDAEAVMSGAVGQRRVPPDHIRNYPLDLPPFSEQSRIVAKIDALSARSKRARADLDCVEALTSRARQAILIAAYKGELTKSWRTENPQLECAEELVAKTPEPDQSRGGREATADVKPGLAALSVNDPGTPIPPGWKWVRLRRIARQETGHTPSRSHPEYWDGGVAWIGIRDAGAHHGRTINETIQTISDAGLANSSARLLPAGTVCLSRTASVGYVTIMGRSMATSQDFATWTCTSALDPEYLMFALMAEGDNIRNFGEGTTHTTIYFPEVRAFHICLPPKQEQIEIVRRVKLALTVVERAADDARKAATLLDRLDQGILAKAFRGELVPQDPADEPASVLLDRIRAERAQAAVPKRRAAVARSAA